MFSTRSSVPVTCTSTTTVSDTRLSPNAQTFQPNITNMLPQSNNDAKFLADTLANTVGLGRLPIPEPSIFTGDPIEYMEWKNAFEMLIDRKGIPPQEKIFYLKKYVSGPARQALEGFLYSGSEAAFVNARKVLDERYGNTFVLQQAFRKKLENWPKISNRDPKALRNFADFLQGCKEAMMHIPSLSILNDCSENQKLLGKLPEWASVRWNRVVTEGLDSSNNYPSFSQFVEFVAREAKVACNPISSIHALNNTTETERKRSKEQKIRVLASTASSKSQTDKDKNSKVCVYFEKDGHYVVRCDKFLALSLKDKRSFIREKNLCFGCLRRGHRNKDCQRKHVCGTCKLKHPTCLHEDRQLGTPCSNPIADNNVNTASSLRVSHQNGKGTSMIVPVWVSSKEEASREVLTYALLDTQSDTTFILDDTASALQLTVKPVKLGLSTITSQHTVIDSSRVNGLQVRGFNSPAKDTVPINLAYTRNFIPADYSHIPKKNTVDDWPHLQPIRDEIPPLQSYDKEVGERFSQEDTQFLNLMEHIKQREDKQLEMPLPFKKRPVLPDNKPLAEVRLNHLKNKFKKDPKYFAHYQKFMKEILERGDAEVVDSDIKSREDDGNIWYIPHHSVYHPKKPNKLRVVFDCSARYGDCSLNDHLLTGPDLTNALAGVLCRFRKSPIGIMCDIEKTFHQFIVDVKDRDFLRFLWWESAKTQESELPIASSFIQRNFYVEDGLTSVETEDEAIQLVNDAQDLCANGGLRLHKFLSNNKRVVQAVPVSERAVGVSLDLTLDPLPVERALGVQWCVECDTFKFQISVRNEVPTRRTMLSIVASVFDPLGFLSPFTLRGKQILQEMCRNGVGWDDPLPNCSQPQWEAWIKDIQNLSQVNIPRCLKPSWFGIPTVVELHHFSDASSIGYGQCSYVRLVNNTEVHCALVASKARVTPVKVVTIPRLELTAAVLSVKMSIFLKNELDLYVNNEYFWTDSRVVLGYINNEARRFQVFVANRVQMIRDATEPQQWRYIDTKDNPADHASRCLTASEIVNSTWLTGPPFLWQPNIQSDEIDTSLQPGDPEVRQAKVLHSVTTPALDIIDCLERFSSWKTTVSVVARLQRLSNGIKGTHHTSVEERENAERTIVRLVQGQAFKESMNALKASETLPRTSRLYPLDPFLQDGVIRVGGRLRNAECTMCYKHPMILPKNSHVTRLILAHVHQETKHQGRGITLNKLRSCGFWIVDGSKTVAKFIRHCVICRKLRRPTEC
ncbi:uncharacterized protein [Argopecten irradians]|uniref:uncharacterized protein n=1 Tax=Argopecten irradians TaxID=31199 RepID=UPI003712C195